MGINLELIKAELEEIDQKLIFSFNILDKVDSKRYLGCTSLAEIEVEILGELAVITVGFPENFPNEIPKFYDSNNLFGDIPHKLSSGFLCFTRSESLLIDVRHPASILLNCLEKVIKLIEVGVKGENKDDFVKEFEVYWPSALTIYAHIDTTVPTVRELNLWSTKIDKNYLMVATEKVESLDETINIVFGLDVNKAVRYRCIYIPLKEGTFLLPPLNDEWSFTELKDNIFSNLSGQNKKEFNRIVNRSTKDVHPIFEYVIVGLPNSNGNVSLFGCGIDGNVINLNSFKKKTKVKKHIHPFVMRPKDTELYPAKIKRWHPEYLLNRTGGNRKLKDKHILIAGVGSVGSEVALRFAKAGVKKLTLVDFDDMAFENVHRHVLGMDKVFLANDELFYDCPKVWGVKSEINRKYPFTEVETHWKSIFSVMDEVKISKSDIDLIVIAIGSPNNEMRINRKLFDIPDPPPTIYTWVEPLGIGGHTLVTLNGEKEGCYLCLFKADEESPIYNRSAFAQPGQDFSKTITGCGSIFTPYNFLDSERSAMLTVETGIKVLMGKIKGNPLLSWKGEDELFKENGYKTTIRYTFSNEELNERKHLYKNDNCLVCSN
ncbi:ThiF family adenylyltransferase [Fredinandcohnia onubensis]|uniref:ThiF family adenylyltransferase n=1 Tax=Fredinandcohnia onubensis TaxID=1571209 RepID=UPI000C0BCA30|nr:ThiF family adenylyltransferase [Fredinandcohnia onubensis]